MNQLSPRWAAIAQLQEKSVQFFDSSSYDFDIYDHAVGLALEDDRTNPKFLAHNSYRHAKTTVIRSKASRPIVFRASELNDGDFFDSFQQKSVDWEQEIVQRDIIKEISLLAKKRSHRMAVCFQDWQHGETIADTGKKLNIDPKSVTKMRQRFKQLARQHISGVLL